jgi:hypothetical protein
LAQAEINSKKHRLLSNPRGENKKAATERPPRGPGRAACAGAGSSRDGSPQGGYQPDRRALGCLVGDFYHGEAHFETTQLGQLGKKRIPRIIFGKFTSLEDNHDGPGGNFEFRFAV